MVQQNAGNMTKSKLRVLVIVNPNASKGPNRIAGAIVLVHRKLQSPDCRGQVQEGAKARAEGQW
jgi:hypothetical protein